MAAAPAATVAAATVAAAVMTVHVQAHLLFMVQIQLEHTMVIVGQMEQVISILNGRVLVLQQI